MSSLYIDIEPSMYQSFLKIFDDLNEDGYVAFHLEGYRNHKITADTLYETMVLDGRGIFGVSCKLPELVEKMELEVIKHDGNAFVVFNLAAFLGLPGDNPIEEMKELKTLLSWIKDETINNPSHTIKLCLTREKQKTEINVICADKSYQEKLQKEFLEKIAGSKILSCWKDNQEKAYSLVEKKASTLWYSMDCLTLLDLEERVKVLEKRPKIKEVYNNINSMRNKNKLRNRLT